MCALGEASVVGYTCADLIGSIVEEEGDDIKKECRVEDIEVLWTHGASLCEGRRRGGESGIRGRERWRKRSTRREE